jgi:hypothetical protein
MFRASHLTGLSREFFKQPLSKGCAVDGVNACMYVIESIQSLSLNAKAQSVEAAKG